MNIESLKSLESNFTNGKLRLSVCFLMVSSKYSNKYALVPENLDLLSHINSYPLTDYDFAEFEGSLYTTDDKGQANIKYDLERMVHILELITTIPAEYKDSITEYGFVSIKSKYIKNYFKDYMNYLDYWIKTGVIVTDNQYIVGQKSIGYKFSPEYENSPLVKRYFRGYSEDDIIPIKENIYNKETGKFEQNPILNYPYLTHWYMKRKIQFDFNIAKKYAKEVMERKLSGGRVIWDENRDKYGEKKHPRTQYNAILHNLYALDAHDYRAKIDANVHRLHSVLTNMQKDYRNFITYNGLKLINIDIKNCQPYLLCLLLNPEFWKIDSTLPINLYTQPENVQKLFTTHAIPLRVAEFFSTLDSGVFNQYKELVASGLMYEKIVEVCSEELGFLIIRDEAKTLMFYLLFSGNKKSNKKSKINQMKNIFENNLFPEVAQLFSIIKEKTDDSTDKQHSRLAVLLQSIESSIILHKCCKIIWEDGSQQIPVFTIHDSIATTSEHVDYVRSVMEEQLISCIGVFPSLNIEEWNVAKLKYQDIYHNIIQE